MCCGLVGKTEKKKKLNKVCLGASVLCTATFSLLNRDKSSLCYFISVLHGVLPRAGAHQLREVHPGHRHGGAGQGSQEKVGQTDTP